MLVGLETALSINLALEGGGKDGIIGGESVGDLFLEGVVTANQGTGCAGREGWRWFDCGRAGVREEFGLLGFLLLRSHRWMRRADKGLVSRADHLLG